MSWRPRNEPGYHTQWQAITMTMACRVRHVHLGYFVSVSVAVCVSLSPSLSVWSALGLHYQSSWLTIKRGQLIYLAESDTIFLLLPCDCVYLCECVCVCVCLWLYVICIYLFAQTCALNTILLFVLHFPKPFDKIKGYKHYVIGLRYK